MAELGVGEIVYRQTVIAVPRSQASRHAPHRGLRGLNALDHVTNEAVIWRERDVILHDEAATRFYDERRCRGRLRGGRRCRGGLRGGRWCRGRLRGGRWHRRGSYDFEYERYGTNEQIFLVTTNLISTNLVTKR